MPVDICKRVGRNIRVLRTQKEWTQKVLGDFAEVSRQHIADIEAGKKEMRLRTLERIAGELSVEIADLLQ